MVRKLLILAAVLGAWWLWFAPRPDLPLDEPGSRFRAVWVRMDGVPVFDDATIHPTTRQIATLSCGHPIWVDVPAPAEWTPA